MSGVKRYQLPITDESFEQEFKQWWEDDGQYVRNGGTGHEVPFAFQAWRYLIPMIALLQANYERLVAENERLKQSSEDWVSRAFELGERLDSAEAELEALRQQAEQDSVRIKRVKPHSYKCANVQAGATADDKCDCGAVVDGVAVVAPVVTKQQGEQEPFAWSTFDGEGGYDLRLYENNEAYLQEWIKSNGTKYSAWVFPLYTAPPSVSGLVEALEFYSNGDHLLLFESDCWDTCSGEPSNFLHDAAGTASVEDGSIAKASLAAHRAKGGV